MKIIDKNTGKRVGAKDQENKTFKKKLKEDDPIIRNVEKGDMEELSPMDPPDAYDPERMVDMSADQLHNNLRKFVQEHEEAIGVCDRFEKALHNFKDGGYYITKEINDSFNAFFVYFDEEILPHNRKEEKDLFPILHERFLTSGEHSEGENPRTPVDLMEDEHVKFIQLATLTFNFLGLAVRLKDPEARVLTLDLAFNNGKELVETLKLHIFREDHTIFPLAQKLLSTEELNKIYGEE
ncbi:MAG: hemerythrin domain-containing protein [Flavobacteriales bacterium]|nr:hemerythrin domain-containing protein [Flavobacteriales bacterium]